MAGVVGWCAALAIAKVVFAAPVVSDVRLVQRTDSRTVDIFYRLTGEDAYITVGIETNALADPAWSGVKIPDSRVTLLSGDVSRRISADAVNAKRIVWNAGAELPGMEIGSARAVVTAWATNFPPPYLVFDMGGDAGGGDYFTAHTITPFAYPSAEALPHGGLTNDIYRTSLMVMRRIDAGAFAMGSPGTELGRNTNENLRAVTVSHAFYMGVFEFTKGQWRRLKVAGPTTVPCNPADSETYDSIRGGTWPLSDDAISAGSLIGTLRSRSNNAFAFDLPTEAQWEYACRAGTQTALYNGLDLTTTSALCPNRFPLAWDAFDSGAVVGVNDPNTRRHHRVGEKLPNAWGLYDMLGNVNENVRDWYTDNLGTAAVTEPTGPSTGTARVRKGGAYDGQRDPRAAYRNTTSLSPSIGFRLALVPWSPAP